jgi:hypothetical protein
VTTAKNNLLNRVAALDPNSRDIVDPNAQFGDENFPIVGADSRIGRTPTSAPAVPTTPRGPAPTRSCWCNIPANRKRVGSCRSHGTRHQPDDARPGTPKTGQYGPVYDEKEGVWSDDGVHRDQTELRVRARRPKCLVKVIQKMSGLA